MKIKTDEIKNTKVTIYKNAKSDIKDEIKLIDFLLPLQQFSKDKIIELRNIKDVNKQKEYKSQNLIGVTISAICGNSRRQKDIVKYNNIMCVDIDEEDNKYLFQKYGVDEIKKCLFDEFKFIYSACLSCRGKGFYLIIPIPDAKDIEIYYKSIYYKLKEYNIIIDEKCKDVTRLRFISYDENILIRNTEFMDVYDEINIKQIEEIRKQKLNESKKISTNYSLTYNEQIQQLKNTVEYIVKFKGFDVGEKWSNWAVIGGYFKSLGEDGRLLFHYISENSKGYKGYDDVEKNWKRFRYDNNVNLSLAKFYKTLNNLYGNGWQKEMKILMKKTV